MQTFKCFMLILKKNKGSLLLYLGIFSVLLIIMSSSNKNTKTQMYKDEKIEFTVIDRDNSRLSSAITKYLSENNKFVKEEDDKTKLQQEMYYRNIYYALIIPEGFEDAIKSGDESGNIKLTNYKVKDSSMGYYMDLKVNAYMKTLKGYMAGGCNIEEAIKNTGNTMDKSITVKMKKEDNKVTYSDDYYYYRVLPYILMALIISAIGPVYIAFGRDGIRQRISASSLTLKSQNLQFVLGASAVSFVMLVMFNILPLILYGSDMTVIKLILYVANTLCFILIAVAITIMFGNIASSDAILASMINVVALGTSFLGGVFVPVEIFGKNMRMVAKFMPTYWYIYAVDDIVKVKEFTFEALGKILQGMGMQLMFALAFMSIAAAIVRRRRYNGADT